MDNLLANIMDCKICQSYLPFAPKPILQVSPDAKILIIGQAPGSKVQQTGVPWNDMSGNELRRWLGVNKEQFYNPNLFAFMPMGFCYPGKGNGGDLPPRPECAPKWHAEILAKMQGIKLTILIGQYAQKYYLKDNFNPTLTENVRQFKNFIPNGYLPLVHPSPRNKVWHKRNPWFELEILPELQQLVASII